MDLEVEMDLDLLAKHNYFVKHNDQIGAFEIMCVSREGEISTVQTNIRTETKADKACTEWKQREEDRVTDEMVHAMAGMMRVEFDRQVMENGGTALDLRLMAVAGLFALHLYAQNNSPGKKN